MKPTRNEMPVWQKQVIGIAGLLLALAGLPMIVGYFCITLILTAGSDREAITAGLISFTLMVVTVGAGGVTFWHSLRSLQRKTSNSLRLPPVWMLIGIFFLFVGMGSVILENDFAVGLFFPPILLTMATLPSLGAIFWFIVDQNTEELTWRRGLVACAGGATVSVIIAAILAILFTAIIMALVADLADSAMDSVEALINAPTRREMASFLSSQRLIFVFIQFVIILPLVEELTKPLVSLPLIGRLSRRGTFLVGTMIGVGFAAIENVLLIGLGLSFWITVLVVRAIGGAIHPLNTGIVSQGWRDILRKEDKAWSKWLVRFALATGLHAFWNGGSLLVVTLASALSTRGLPPQIDSVGMAAAVVTLALLIVVGLVSLWAGRSIVRGFRFPSPRGELTKTDLALSNRVVAIWALVCLIVIVPAGIVGIQILAK